PQRQRDTRLRPARPNGRPSWSTISKSPSTRSEPLFITVMRALAILTSWAPAASGLVRGTVASHGGTRRVGDRRPGGCNRTATRDVIPPSPVRGAAGVRLRDPASRADDWRVGQVVELLVGGVLLLVALMVFGVVGFVLSLVFSLILLPLKLIG